MAKAIMELCDLSDKEREAMGMKGQEYIRMKVPFSAGFSL